MVFCPVCKTEYRAGFTECADCYVALVEELPEADAPEAYLVLWKGESAEFAEKLVEELDKEGVVGVAVPIDLLYRQARDFFDVAIKPLFGSAVFVKTRDYEAARDVKQKFLKEALVRTQSMEDSTAEPPAELLIPDLPLKWNPATATVEIWRGKGDSTRKFVADALHGVGIPTRSAVREGGEDALLVREEDAERGKEIVREIEEGAEPREPLPGTVEYVWEDEPIRSFALLWSVAVGYILLLVLAWKIADRAIDALLAVCAAVANVGAIWMLYQAVRYEVRVFRFVVLCIVPFSFIWYYHERYLRRRGLTRLPIGVRLKIHPPPA